MKRLFLLCLWFLFLMFSLKGVIQIKQPGTQLINNSPLYPDRRLPFISPEKSMISEKEFQRLLERNQMLRKSLFKKKILK